MKRWHSIGLYIIGLLILAACGFIIWILLFRQNAVPKLMVVTKTVPPSTQQIINSVGDYLTKNPPLPGASATPSQITNAVNDYLTANPPKAGTNGTNGINGLNGSCSVQQIDTGAAILCADGTSAIITNGNDGKTPILQCNEVANRWEIRYSEDDNWTILSGHAIRCKV